MNGDREAKEREETPYDVGVLTLSKQLLHSNSLLKTLSHTHDIANYFLRFFHRQNTIKFLSNIEWFFRLRLATILRKTIYLKRDSYYNKIVKMLTAISFKAR